MLIQLAFHRISPCCLLLWYVVIQSFPMPDKTLLTRWFPLIYKGACLIRLKFNNCDRIYGSCWPLHQSFLLLAISPAASNIQFNIVSSYIGFFQLGIIPIFLHCYTTLIYILPAELLSVLWIYCFHVLQSTRVIGAWGVWYHSCHSKVFTTIKRSCLDVMRIISTNDCWICSPVGNRLCLTVSRKGAPDRNGFYYYCLLMMNRCQWYPCY